jgi:hypothetical protein
MDWCDMSKDIKFICNTFIWDLIAEFYKATKKQKKNYLQLVNKTLSWVIVTFFSIVMKLQVLAGR